MATRRRLIVLLATCLVTLAGGAVDAWVYLGHGHVFANAQSGNIVLMGIALAQDDFKERQPICLRWRPSSPDCWLPALPAAASNPSA